MCHSDWKLSQPAHLDIKKQAANQGVDTVPICAKEMPNVGVV